MRRRGDIQPPVEPAVEAASEVTYVLLQGFSATDVETIRTQLSRFGLVVISNGDPSQYGKVHVVSSGHELAALYARYGKSFEVIPEPVVAEPVMATVATESAFEAAPDPELGAWGDER